MQEYTTITAYAKDNFTERKSEFIGYITPAKTSEDAIEFINTIRAENRKANHNVYAYILRDGNATRYSDDGEPQGTAGIPVLEVLQKEGLSDVCCVVTRYFGGILLGGGGLIRAYSHAAKIAVEAGTKLIMRRGFKIKLTANYNFYGKISYILPDFEVKIINTNFTSDINIEFLVLSTKVEALLNKLTDICNGQVELYKSDEITADFS